MSDPDDAARQVEDAAQQLIEAALAYCRVACPRSSLNRISLRLGRKDHRTKVTIPVFSTVSRKKPDEPAKEK